MIHPFFQPSSKYALSELEQRIIAEKNQFVNTDNDHLQRLDSAEKKVYTLACANLGV